MYFSPRSANGFKINDEIAQQIGLFEEFRIYADDWDYDPFCFAFKEKYNTEPDEIKFFEYERGGYIQGLEGFEYDEFYVLFSDHGDLSGLPIDIEVEYGEWSELG
jgi:hypothetical protein